MARKSRKSISSNFVHVMVQGINKEYIFEKSNYKRKYLSLLFSNIKNFDINTISFCVMDNHSHFVFYFKKIEEISKLMHKVNTLYAKWYNEKNNRVGYVFRDRYKVEEIMDLHHLYSCIKYVHNNPVKAGIVTNPEDYKFSSYRNYLGHYGIYNAKLKEILQLSDIDVDNIILGSNNLILDNYKTTKYVKELQEFINKKGIKTVENMNSLESKKELILFLKNSCNLNYTEISNILGFSRTTIYRILNN